MAQMRMKDQDLIVEQVVSKIETIEFEKLKARKDVQKVQANAKERIKVISRLVKKYVKLEENIKAEKKELKTLIESFQTANGYGLHNSSQGLYLNDGYNTNTVPTCYVVWQMNWGQKGEISTKLRLQTMGGDFNAYELIEQLVHEFSN